MCISSNPVCNSALARKNNYKLIFNRCMRQQAAAGRLCIAAAHSVVATALTLCVLHPCYCNREIVGLGVANFFGAAFNAYTATGSFSLSSVNNASGAKTQLSGVVTSMIVMFVLLFLTPVFALMPYNTMAAIIIASCTTLFEWRVARQLFKVIEWTCCHAAGHPNCELYVLRNV